jgi:hypothetical protein
VISHAGAGGEPSSFDTRDFNIQVSSDGASYTTVVNVAGNTSNVTTHTITPVSARFVRLNVVTPTQTTDPSARIYEVEVYAGSGGSDGGVAADSGASADARLVDAGSDARDGSTAAPVTFEMESLPVAGSSGDTHRIAYDSGYSGGAGTILEGNAAGDFVTYTVAVPQAGTYDVRVGIKRLDNRGIWQLSVDGVNRGPAVDGYAATASFTEVDLGAVAISAGNRAFRFTLTGKNASSTSYWTSLDYVRLIPQ